MTFSFSLHKHDVAVKMQNYYHVFTITIAFTDTVQKKFPDVPKKFIRAALREKLNDEHKLRAR